ncbi:GTP-binding protein Era [Anaplasma phagocytophilum str. ApNP]|nr:GTP-binding protein Era [Anaplasma phagocytophilum str. ApNP]
MKGADMVVLVLDAKRRICVHVEKIIKRLQRDNIASIAVINKMDLLDEGELATFAERVQLLHKFDRVFTVSSLYGTGVRDLIDYLQESACDGPWLYPEEYRTDATLEFFAAEITREKLYLALRQELPYSLSVVTEQIEEKGDSIIIKQVIYVMKESQKTIVVGADAALIKSVSTAARYELSAMLNKKVHLYLFVKVRKFWQDHLEECVGYS